MPNEVLDRAKEAYDGVVVNGIICTPDGKAQRAIACLLDLVIEVERLRALVNELT